MSRALRFAIVVALGLAAPTSAVVLLLDHTTRGWFEQDLRAGAVSAVASVRPAMVEALRHGSPEAVGVPLREIASGDDVIGAAACGRDGVLVASAGRGVADAACRLAPDAVEQQRAVSSVAPLAGVPRGLQITAVPVSDRQQPLGAVVVGHDLALMDARRHALRRLVISGFAAMVTFAVATTIVAARLAWRDWTRELTRFLRGEAHRPEFAPLAQDVRDLVRRIADESQADGQGGRWTPERLKRTLGTHLHGGRVITVANREPYIHEREPSGAIVVRRPASGLVTALEPIMRACSGVWVAHGSGNADRDVVDAMSRLRVPPDEESYVLRRVWMSPDEERGYYSGFANEGLWPLCHIAHTRPAFRGGDWEHYRTVNRRFADAVCAEADADDPIVLVQDYHFALVPRMLRERLPRATILTFWHIPWPNAERVAMCPWKDELLRGLLGSSIMGFHTQLHCNNFTESVDRYLEARIDREQFAVTQDGRSTLVRAYPISIEWPSQWAAAAPPVDVCRREVRESLGVPAHLRLGVGVDRLDYTKGIEERLLAVERLLERRPEYRERFSFVQLAAPSRDTIDAYQQVTARVDREVARINERFGSASWRPLILRHAHHEPPEVFRFYRAADVCYVSSLHDGMNLVAKEFVAARDDERGVLVLSAFTGAARELTESLIVNPYDLDEAADALALALEMPPEEQAARMRAMRSLLAELNVYRWAGRMLMDAARLRRREPFAGRARRGRAPAVAP